MLAFILEWNSLKTYHEISIEAYKVLMMQTILEDELHIKNTKNISIENDG